MKKLTCIISKPLLSTFLFILVFCFMVDPALFSSSHSAIFIDPPPSFAKIFAPDDIYRDEISTLTFTIDNTASAIDATALNFTDNLPAGVVIATPANASNTCGGTLTAVEGTSVITYSGGTVAAGAACTISVDVTSSISGNKVNTTGDLTSSLGNSGTASDALFVAPEPVLYKTFAPNPIAAGGVSTLTFAIDALPHVAATSDLAFTDNLPAGVVVASPPNVTYYEGGSPSFPVPGVTVTAVAGSGVISCNVGVIPAADVFFITVDVTSSTPGVHVNTTSELSLVGGALSTRPATDTLTVTAPQADISVTKNDGVTSAVPGGSVTYTIVVSNAGPSADPAVTLTDTFPSPPLTCTWSSVAAGGATGNTAAGAGDLSETLSMPAGSSVTYTATCQIDSDATGTLSNTATAAASVTDPTPGNNSATDSDTVLVPEADLAVTKTDSADPVAPGDNLTYTVTVNNNGPSDALNVVVTDTLPAGVILAATAGCAEDPAGVATCTLGTIAAGASAQYTIDVAVDARTSGTITNQATVTSDATDPVPGNNSITEDTDVTAQSSPPTQPPPQRYRLSVIKTGSGDGTVQSNIAGIDCGPDCMQYYNATTTITLSATPDEGSTFDGWSGACPGTGSCAVNLTGDTTVTPVFNKIDSDGDGTPDENDRCPDDPDKTEPGDCGCGMTDADNNQNGISDCLDTDDDNIPDDLDMDGNDIPDQDQSDMWVVSDGTGNVYFGAVVPAGVVLESLEWIDPSTIDDTTNRPDEFPLGLVTFRLLTENPGDTVELTIYCSEPIPEDASWYKYDPVYGWYDFSDYVVISEDRMSVTLTIEDGGFGDGDGEVNGVIDDPSGPGLFIVDDTTDDTPTAKKGGGGSSGCFLEAVTAD